MTSGRTRTHTHTPPGGVRQQWLDHASHRQWATPPAPKLHVALATGAGYPASTAQQRPHLVQQVEQRPALVDRRAVLGRRRHGAGGPPRHQDGIGARRRPLVVKAAGMPLPAPPGGRQRVHALRALLCRHMPLHDSRTPSSMEREHTQHDDAASHTHSRARACRVMWQAHGAHSAVWPQGSAPAAPFSRHPALRRPCAPGRHVVCRGRLVHVGGSQHLVQHLVVRLGRQAATAGRARLVRRPAPAAGDARRPERGWGGIHVQRCAKGNGWLSRCMC